MRTITIIIGGLLALSGCAPQYARFNDFETVATVRVHTANDAGH